MNLTVFFVSFAVIAILILLWGIKIYNGLVRLSNMKDAAWSGVDVQLKRRSDLVPNLVETVKGCAAHEQNAIQAVIEARSAVASAGAQRDRIEAENALSSTLRSLFAAAENHPALKANEAFGSLRGELSSLENELQMARCYYNGTVRDFNSAIHRFPNVLISRRLGYGESPFYGIDEESRAPVQVKF